VAFSPDGRLLAVGTGDRSPKGSDAAGEVKVFAADTGQEILSLPLHMGPVDSVAFSQDGMRLLMLSASRNAGAGKGEQVDGEVIVWDIARREQIQAFKGHFGKSTVFSADGKRLATVYGKTLFSADGKPVATAYGDIEVYDAMTGQLVLKSVKGRAPLAFSPDGKRLVSAAPLPLNAETDSDAKVWNAATGQDLATLQGHTDRLTSVAFSPDGKRVATASKDQTIKIWEADTGQEVFTLKGQNCVAFSPDGNLAAVSDANTVKIWNADNFQDVHRFKWGLGGGTKAALSVAFSANGKRLAACRMNSAPIVWDTEKGQEVRALGSAAVANFLLRDGQPTLTRLAYSPDGQRLAISWGVEQSRGDIHPAVMVIDPDKNKVLLSLKGDSNGVTSVAFSPDGNYLATGSKDWTVRLWEPSTGKELRILERPTTPGGHPILSVAFSPDSQRLAGAGGGLKVWDTQTGRLLLSLDEIKDTVKCVAFSPDGKRLVSAGGSRTNLDQPGEVYIWDAHTGQKLLSLPGHQGPVFAVAVSPDGQCLATAGANGALKVWDAGTGKELFSLVGHQTHVTCVAFSPDGKRLASGSIEGNSIPADHRVWELEQRLKTHVSWKVQP
jgi:WD40 repeat protein